MNQNVFRKFDSLKWFKIVSSKLNIKAKNNVDVIIFLTKNMNIERILIRIKFEKYFEIALHIEVGTFIRGRNFGIKGTSFENGEATSALYRV